MTVFVRRSGGQWGIFMDIVLLIVRLSLFVIFAWSGLTKLADLDGTRKAFLDFGVPEAVRHPLAVVLPLGELAVALSILLARSAWWGAWGALALLILFSAGILANLLSGRRPTCHCFGRFSSGPIGWTSLGRNLALSLLAGLIIRQYDGSTKWIGEIPSVDKAELTLQIAAFCLLAVEGWYLVRLVRAYEQFAPHPAASPLPAERSSKPDTSLPIGSLAPEFQLPDADGAPTKLADLRALGRSVALIFVDARCNACLELLPALGHWQRDHADKLTFVAVFSGSVETTRTKSSDYELTHVLQQSAHEVADAYGVRRTPSAIVVRSRLASGTPDVKALVEQMVTNTHARG